SNQFIWHLVHKCETMLFVARLNWIVEYDVGRSFSAHPCEKRREAETVQLRIAKDSNGVALLRIAGRAAEKPGLEIKKAPARSGALKASERSRLVWPHKVPPRRNLTSQRSELRV